MGSISSRPKVPKVSQPTVVFVPAPDSGGSGSGQVPLGDASETTSDPVLSEEQQQTEDRAANLLQRNRGRFGTILTGFRGLLSSSQGKSGRKTLLGE